jgi:hypothetical protein
MPRFLQKALLGAALVVPVAVGPAALFAYDDHVYHDQDHHDDHHWDQREDQAYRSWVKETHRKYYSFSKLKAEDQQRYWNWRHDHPDAH